MNTFGVIFMLIFFIGGSGIYHLNKKRKINIAKDNIQRYWNLIGYMLETQNINHIRFKEDLVQIVYNEKSVPNLTTDEFYKSNRFRIEIKEPREANFDDVYLNRLTIKTLETITLPNLLNNTESNIELSEESIERLSFSN